MLVWHIFRLSVLITRSLNEEQKRAAWNLSVLAAIFMVALL